MSKRAIVLCAVAALAAAAIAGCGGGDDETETVTMAEFISQADRICESSNADREAALDEYIDENGLDRNQPPSDAQATEIVETVLVPELNEQVEELRALDVPAGDEEEVEAIFDAVAEVAESVEADPAGLFAAETSPFAEADRLAQEYGFRVCGQS